MCQRWGQHPDAIRHGDSYAFRLLALLQEAGLLGGDDEDCEAGRPGGGPPLSEEEQTLAGIPMEVLGR